MTLDNLSKPFFVLAPMDDVTDTVFRRIVAECAAPDLFFTEFVNVDGLQSPGRVNLLKKLKFTEREQPLIAQIWGTRPENFYKTAQQLADGTFARELGLPGDVNFAGIDLNFGCPVKEVVRNGCCSALMNDRDRAVEIIRATLDGTGGKLPVSVKTRLGFNEVDLSWHELLLKQNLAMLTIHGRTKKQMSKVPADWATIGKIRELRDKLAPGTLIVGNGDVESRQQGLDLAKTYKLDGIMIGRGIFHDPFIFAQNQFSKTRSWKWVDYDMAGKIAIFRRHVELFAETWQPGERAIHTLNKFCKIYISGFDGAKELREQLMAAQSTDELIALLENAAGRATGLLY